MKQIFIILFCGILSICEAYNLTGTYNTKNNGKIGCSLFILQWNNNLIEFEIWCSHGAPDYNQGIIHDTVKIINNNAIYRNLEFADSLDTCNITFSFHKNKIIIEQKGSFGACGFGGNVYCNGTYLLQNKHKPEFKDMSGELIGFKRNTELLKLKQ
jgi:hypothetical protein